MSSLLDSLTTILHGITGLCVALLAYLHGRDGGGPGSSPQALQLELFEYPWQRAPSDKEYAKATPYLSRALSTLMQAKAKGPR